MLLSAAFLGPLRADMAYRGSDISIGDPLRLQNGTILKNRICKSAIGEGFCDWGGDPNQRHFDLYKLWAEGGPSLIVTGNVHVDRNYRERPSSLVLDPESNMSAYKSLVSAVDGHDVSFWVQLNHPGRQCPLSISRNPLGPSNAQPVFRFSGYGKATGMTLAEIDAVKRKFLESAKLSELLGFSGIQIHAAHGYLLSSFLSPILNKRTDKYGGSLINRARLLMEIIESIRAHLSASMTLSVKLNCNDFERGGYDEAQAIEVAKICEDAGAAHFEVSGGSYRRLIVSSEKTEGWDDVWGHPYFRRFSYELTKTISAPITLTGNNRLIEQMTKDLNNGIAMIGCARPFCLNTNYALTLLSPNMSSAKTSHNIPNVKSGRGGQNSRFRRVRRYNALAYQAWYSENLKKLINVERSRDSVSIYKAMSLMKESDKKVLKERLRGRK